MSELQFPKDPVVGQQYDFPPYKYYWDGAKWKTIGIGYNPVNDLRDELELRIETSEKNIEDLSAQSFEALRRSYAEAGFNLVDGSFEDGGTLTSTSGVLLHKATGATYSWSGVFPKVVAAGSTPATSSGIGAGAWVDRTDVVLRDQLAESTGATKVGTSDGRTVEQRLAALPNEVDAAGTAASLIDQHNNDYFAHTHLTEQIAAAVGRAETARDSAEAARDAAIVNSPTYPDEATGRAAVADGAYFKVQGSGDVACFEYRRTNSTTSVLIATYPSGARVEAIGNQVFPRVVGWDAAASGSTVSGTGTTYFWPGTVKNEDQYIESIAIAADSSTTATIVVASVSDGKLTLVSSTVKNLVAGVNSLSNLDIYVPANCVVGIYGSGIYFHYTSPTIVPMWQISTGFAPGTPYVNSNGYFALHHNISLISGLSYKAKAAYSTSQDNSVKIGAERDVGWATLNAGTATAGTDKTWMVAANTTVPSAVSRVDLWAAVTGTIDVVVAVRGNLSTNFTLVEKKTIGVLAGFNSIPIYIEIPVGGFVGIHAVSAGILRYSNSNNPNPTGILSYQTLGVPGVNTAESGSPSTLFRFEMTFGVVAGLYKDLSKNASMYEEEISGLRALASADNTGATDATSSVAAALTNFDFPYVPAGKFSVTSLPKYGRGLYGPGKLYVGGQRYFLPKKQDDKALLQRLRSSLADVMANNDVLSFVGDSITHYMGASAADKHYLELLTSYANFGVASDKPTMTALVNSNTTYTPSFYGVTLAGTTATGSNGPLSESLVLTPGASLSFTGTYEQVDCFYTQSVGAGTLTFAFNGTAFKTVNANGSTEKDKYSGPTATAQTGSGTYTITASVANVEITGLIRLGTLASGRMRLRTSRCAHGSYRFTNFNSAAVTSIVKQGTYAGGKCVPVLALGTNDTWAFTPDQVVSNASAVINLFIAAGITRMYAIPQFRAANELADMKLRKLYKDYNIVVVDTDSVDWWNSGLLQDTVHPNDAGNDLLAQMVIECLAK